MKPKTIKKTAVAELTVVWDDTKTTIFTFEQLRDSCPCAGCAGETVLFQSYIPPEPDRATPGRYILKKIDLVGSYAIQLTWGDGHNTGIYTWEFLERVTKA